MSPKLRNRLLALGALAAAGATLLFLTQSSLGENLVYYWTPSEMLAQGGKAVGPTIRLGGVVEGGSIRWDGHTLHFRVCDSESVPQKTCVPVQASQVPPQMFREHIGVVIEGTLSKNTTFSSKRLMVNHSNEYQAPTAGHPLPNWKDSFSEDTPTTPPPPLAPLGDTLPQGGEINTPPGTPPIPHPTPLP